jgi:hypothetical protein
MRSAADGQEKCCFGSSDSGSSVVVVKGECSNGDWVNVCSGTISVEKGIIPMHAKLLAARPTEADLFHALEKIVQNLAFLLC